MDIEIGTKVKVKSGGPIMTVVASDGKDAVCTWYDDGRFSSASFPPKALDAVDYDNKRT